MADFIALIPAAGTGSRIGEAVPKQYLSLAGKPMIYHAMHALFYTERITRIGVVLSPDDTDWEYYDWSKFEDKLMVLRCGGATRAGSVTNGLRALQASGSIQDQDWVLVHDAARPGLSIALVERLLDQLTEDDVGGILAIPLADTLKRANSDNRIACTEPRDALWQAQTPQMFRAALLLEALQNAPNNITDDASAIEATGRTPKLVMGDAYNFKVTYPQDMALAALILKENKT
ncbi:MAG: 2-C-methyl-D-erythritol 4-phosphate cytidylyltransferase [Nitrosomonas sp.]|nr:2-C-methyl-D-erythritol 4-phosphate cytidylyltransferase [Nitrosomonas sp.]